MIVKCGIIYIYPTKILRVVDVGETNWEILIYFIINEVKFKSIIHIIPVSYTHLIPKEDWIIIK